MTRYNQLNAPEPGSPAYRRIGIGLGVFFAVLLVAFVASRLLDHSQEITDSKIAIINGDFKALQECKYFGGTCDPRRLIDEIGTNWQQAKAAGGSTDDVRTCGLHGDAAKTALNRSVEQAAIPCGRHTG